MLVWFVVVAVPALVADTTELPPNAVVILALVKGVPKSKQRKNHKQNVLQRAARLAVGVVARGGVVKELSKGDTNDQIGRLRELQGKGILPSSNLRKALEKQVPKELDKTIKRFKKEGKEISVESLVGQVTSDNKFMAMCANAGLTPEWFNQQAKERMEVSN